MIRGWCPTVHAPMPSGDGLLARVKPFGGRLPAARLAALAEAAARYGNGTVELTSRGNLQVRGVQDAAGFAQAMVAAGLADADPMREARRNVIAVPPCDDALVAEVEAVLADTPGLAPKFCVVVRGAEIFVGGEAVEVGALREVLVRIASALTPTLSREGREREKEGRLPSPPPLAGGGRGEGCNAHDRLDMRPPLPQGEGRQTAGTHLLYLPFHQTTAATLTHLATLAPEIRTTPWRAFLSPVLAPGFAIEPGTITACPGGPACSSGTVPARADAVTLRDAGFTHLHVSGCPKGCAHPGPARTLVGRNGHYDLVRYGRAGDVPDRTGLTLAEAMAAL